MWGERAGGTEFGDPVQTYLENEPQVQGRPPDETLITYTEACGDTGVNKTLKLVLKAAAHQTHQWSFWKMQVRGPHPLVIQLKMVSIRSGPQALQWFWCLALAERCWDMEWDQNRLRTKPRRTLSFKRWKKGDKTTKKRQIEADS